MTTNGQDHLPCNELVEMVTDYLDDALPPDEASRIEAHLAICAGCASVLEQFRQTIREVGCLRDDQVEALEPAVREHLMNAFRSWAQSRGSRT